MPNDTCNYFELFFASGRFPFNPLEREVEGTINGGGGGEDNYTNKHKSNQGHRDVKFSAYSKRRQLLI